MSSFNFLDDEVSEVEKANKDLAQLDRQAKKPPAQWSAARTKSTFEEQSLVGDRAGAQGGGGGGGGPSLPFRIREVKLFPVLLGQSQSPASPSHACWRAE